MEKTANPASRDVPVSAHATMVLSAYTLVDDGAKLPYALITPAQGRCDDCAHEQATHAMPAACADPRHADINAYGLLPCAPSGGGAHRL